MSARVPVFKYRADEFEQEMEDRNLWKEAGKQHLLDSYSDEDGIYDDE